MVSPSHLAAPWRRREWHLFVTEKGTRKSQATLTVQIIDAIAQHVGIHMTPHQFRHFGATSYLEDHPEDFETARAMLGHAWSKTTRIYAGSSSRRASRAYNQHLFKQREALKLLRSRRKRRRQVKTMRTLKHLPENEWPEADRQAFRAAYEPGDVFDETAGPGAHLAEGTRTWIRFTYRRWLGFLKTNYPDDLSMPPAERITPERVRAFIEHLSAEIRPTSVAITVGRLYAAARLIAPTAEWAWLRSVKSRLECLARPQDRFDRLVPPVHTLDYGIELMDAALTLPPSDGHKQREIQYRDGLLLALLSHLADTPARPRRPDRQPSS